MTSSLAQNIFTFTFSPLFALYSENKAYIISHCPFLHLLEHLLSNLLSSFTTIWRAAYTFHHYLTILQPLAKSSIPAPFPSWLSSRLSLPLNSHTPDGLLATVTLWKIWYYLYLNVFPPTTFYIHPSFGSPFTLLSLFHLIQFECFKWSIPVILTDVLFFLDYLS